MVLVMKGHSESPEKAAIAVLMKVYNAVNSRKVGAVQELDIPLYLMPQTCVDIPDIDYYSDGSRKFLITIKSLLLPNVKATIRHNRFVTFEQI